MIKVEIKEKNIIKSTIFFDGNIVKSKTGVVVLITDSNEKASNFRGINLANPDSLWIKDGWIKSAFEQFKGEIKLISE